MLKPWTYFSNPFQICVKKSFKKAIKISTYTDAQLFTRKADAFYGPLYIVYHPLHLALIAAYNTWKAQGNVQISSTGIVTQLIKELSPLKINAWDLAIQAVYPKGSAGYASLLAQGHYPFQTGSTLERINRVAQLMQNLEGITALATVETDVTAFWGQLNTAQITQSGNKGNKKTNSNLLTTAIANAMTGLFSILGACIVHFVSNPSVCSAIFDMATIRNQQQSVYIGTLGKSAHHTIAERTFPTTDSFDGYNTGLVTIGYYLAAHDGDGPAGYTVVQVLERSTDTIDIAQFINDTTNKYLSVVNLSAIADATYKVDLG